MDLNIRSILSKKMEKQDSLLVKSLTVNSQHINTIFQIIAEERQVKIEHLAFEDCSMNFKTTEDLARNLL